MTGPFRANRDGDSQTSAVLAANSEVVCLIDDSESVAGFAEAIAGVLNSAPADEPLAETLQRLAEGKGA